MNIARRGWRAWALAAVAGAALSVASLAGPALADPTATVAGKPLIRNYDQREFGAEVQAWDVVQHPSGLVYAANNAGVLEFDGRTWRLIALPSRLEVRAVALDPRGPGTIYVGASGDFGVLVPDVVGRLTFSSLLPPGARADEAFDEVFRPTVTPLGVYFQSRHRLCRLTHERLTCETGAWRSRVFATAGRAYVQSDAGIVELTATGTRPVTGGSGFASSELTVALPSAPRGGDRLLIGTRDFRLFVQDGDRFVPFAASLRVPPGRDALIGATWLPDGTLALATEQRGVLIVDAGGRVQRRIDEQAGLQENHVHAMWPDREGGLWLGLQHGISRVDIGGPYTSFDEDFGLQREWRAVERRGSMIYVRGYRGLYAADLAEKAPDASAGPVFRQIAAIEPPVWTFTQTDEAFLVTSRDGVYEVSGWQARRLATLPSMPMALHASRSESGLVYVGLVEGIGVLRRTAGRWAYEGRLTGVHNTITSLAEERRGRLWAVSQRQRVLSIELDPPSSVAGQPNDIAARVSVPDKGELTGRVIARVVAGRVVFLADNGLFHVDEAGTAIRRSPIFQPLIDAGRRSFAWIAETQAGDLWVASRTPGTVDTLRRRWNGEYAFDSVASLQVPVWSVYPDPSEPALWLAGTDHLWRYDLRTPARPVEQATTLIRRVTINDGDVVYGGAQARPAVGQGQPSPLLEFPHRSNAVHFDFAAPRFASPMHTEYQSYLEGFDPGWSPWSRDPGRSYTNLPCGEYRFHVRSRDASGTIGAETVFTFNVQRPWYRSWLAYGCYGALLAATLGTVWTMQLRRARHRYSRDLQQRELDKLRDLDRMKSRIFTDIAHEFRTPLTLILGPITQLLDQITDADLRRKLQLARGNGDAMLRLLSQLLDLAKLESGRVRLRASREDLVSTVRGIVMPFIPAAEAQDIRLRVDAVALPDDPAGVILHVDRDVVEKIVNNLLVNAIKFTPPGGQIVVGIRSLPAPDAAALGWDAGGAEIAVEDTGIGMPASQLPQIFTRFYQVRGAPTRDGVGVGLALVKELVDLHGGTIDVRSREGQGTTFTVRLPKGTAHLAGHDIVDVPVVDDDSCVLEPTHAPVTEALPAFSPGALDAGVDETTVLVVEDHADVRAFLCDQLRAHYHVLEARDGDEGLQLALERLPDLVISDVTMGAMDGFALCRTLKGNEKTGHIPVVLLTARAGRADRIAGLGFGADCYIVKPFDSTELLARVRNLIEQRRQLRERFRGPVVLKPAEMAVAAVDEVFLTRVLQTIEQHLDDAGFDVEQLGRAVGLSRSQLHRKLRALTNQSPSLVIRSVRLQRAAELLQQNAGSVAEIAYQVGFSSQAYFTKCFREQFGRTPKEYTQV
jgi:signal transduction histidine kinase/AraC-like DNA-binding protein